MTGNGYKRKANTNSSNSKILSKISEKSQNYEKSEKSQKFRERIRERIRKYQQSRYKLISFWGVLMLMKNICWPKTFTNMQLQHAARAPRITVRDVGEGCW